MSAFFFYLRDRREKLKVEQPSLDNKQIVSKMSEEWNNMTDGDKIAFQKQAEADKLRYQKQIKEYEKTKPVSTPAKASAGKQSVKSKASKKEESEEDDAEDEEEDNE